jgi:hypothetical protein
MGYTDIIRSEVKDASMRKDDIMVGRTYANTTKEQYCRFVFKREKR